MYRTALRLRPLAVAASLLLAGAAAAQPATPTRLIAFPGGTSTALRWDAGPGGSPATRFAIYRDGRFLANVSPGFHPTFPEKNGNGYIDTTANVGGRSYRYEVRAYDSSNSASPLSMSLTVMFPKTTTAVPQVVIDASQSPELAGWAQTNVRPLLEIWYPKIVDRLASPGYAPPATIKVRFIPGQTNPAQVLGNEIQVSPEHVKAHREDLGMFIHEATHVVGQHKQWGWMSEGLADWATNFMLRKNEGVMPVNKSYVEGYGEAAFLIQWIQQRYVPDFARILNIAKHEGGRIDSDTDAEFRTLVGKTPVALWREMTGSTPGTQLKIGGRCISNQSWSANVSTCETDIGRYYWNARPADNATFTLRNDAGCLDVDGNGNAPGTRIWAYYCHGGLSQQWQSLANGSLRHVSSGRCLTVAEDSSLQIQDCTGAVTQIVSPRVTVPATAMFEPAKRLREL